MKKIKFVTDMVQAILAGEKTVTRRVIKTNGREIVETGSLCDGTRFVKTVRGEHIMCGYKDGDILRVIEAREDGKEEDTGLLIRVKNVYEDPVQCLNESDAIDEGMLRYFGWVTSEYEDACQFAKEKGIKPPLGKSPRERFAYLWDKLIKPEEHEMYGWDANPYVWVILFKIFALSQPMPQEPKAVLGIPIEEAKKVLMIYSESKEHPCTYDYVRGFEDGVTKMAEEYRKMEHGFFSKMIQGMKNEGAAIKPVEAEHEDDRY